MKRVLVAIQSQFATHSNTMGIEESASESIAQCFHICVISDAKITVPDSMTPIIMQLAC